MFVLVLLGTFAAQGCAQESAPVAAAPVVTAPPAITLDEIAAAVRRAPRISSFVLFQGGEVRFEHHASGHALTRPINIKSASKSILNALTDIALTRGELKSLDTPIAEYLPQYFTRIPAQDPRRRITVRHLLTLSSGQPSTSIHNYGAWVSSRDWVAYVLNQQSLYEPGTRMTYSTGDTHLLAAVLTTATGTPLRTYAQCHLFDPLGVKIGAWDRDPQGIYFGGNNLALSPAAMLAFARLYLRRGTYDGQQVLRAEWIEASWTPRFLNSSYNGRHDYGYLWWHTRLGGESTWFAWGYGGQFLFVLPAREAVVVITGDPDAPSRGGNAHVYELMERAVVPWIARAD